jgi:hypothetical protein
LSEAFVRGWVDGYTWEKGYRAFWRAIIWTLERIPVAYCGTGRR